jgi:hypothetical protein
MFSAGSPAPADIARVARRPNARGADLLCILDLRTPDVVERRGCYGRVLTNLIEYHLPMMDVLPATSELPEWVDPAVVAARNTSVKRS